MPHYPFHQLTLRVCGLTDEVAAAVVLFVSNLLRHDVIVLILCITTALLGLLPASQLFMIDDCVFEVVIEEDSALADAGYPDYGGFRPAHHLDLGYLMQGIFLGFRPRTSRALSLLLLKTKSANLLYRTLLRGLLMLERSWL